MSEVRVYPTHPVAFATTRRPDEASLNGRQPSRPATPKSSAFVNRTRARRDPETGRDNNINHWVRSSGADFSNNDTLVDMVSPCI